MKNKVKIFYGNESGFLSFKSKRLSFAMNIYGHQAFYWDNNITDPRLTGAVPFWMTFKSNSSIPAIPFSHGPVVVLPSKTPLLGRIYRFINSVYSWKNNFPYNAGFLSFLIGKDDILIFQGYEKHEVYRLDDYCIIKGSGELIKFPLFSFKVIINFIIKFKTIFRLKDSSKSLIKSTGKYLDKEIHLSKDYIFIEDKYHLKNPRNRELVPFTIRTYTNVDIKFINEFVCFISPNNTYLAVSITKDEILKKEKDLFSSTGDVTVWKIINKSLVHYNKSKVRRVVTGGDNINELQEINYYNDKIEVMRNLAK